MPHFCTPQQIATESGFSRQSVCFWLRELFPQNGYQHEDGWWWRLEDDEKAFLLAQLKEAGLTHPHRPLYALRKTFVLVFE